VVTDREDICHVHRACESVKWSTVRAIENYINLEFTRTNDYL